MNKAPQQLSTQQIRNTLMALATKKGPLSGFETALALELDKVLPEYLSGIEPSNKARIFRDLAALEFQYIGPRYRISQSINKIKADLKEGLESFNEEDVLLILDAYHYLPATYPNDLLEIFKDVMSNTVVHNPAAVKSSFLVRYIAHAGQLSRARRINPTALNSIFNLVASRLKTDPLMQREIEDLCQYLLKINLSHQQLKTEIISYLKNLQTDSTNTLFKINGFEYVVRNSTPEANKGFVKELINPEIFPKLNTTALRRIKAIIESLNDPDFGPLLKKIEAEPEYSKLENIRSSLFTGGQRGKHHDEALQVVATLFENLKTTGRNMTVQFMTNLLNTIQNRDTQNELIKRPELQNLTTQQIGALLSGLFDLEQSNDSQWSFVLEILKINAERVTSNRVISYLNNNGIKLNAVSLRSPRIVQNWVNFLASLPKIEEERISVIFPLLLRLSDGGIVNYKLIEKFRLNVERCIKEGVPINFSTLGAVTDFLVEHDNCTFEIAQTLFEKSRTQKYVDKSRYRIIAYLYDRKQATPEQKANLQAVAEEEIKKLLTNLGSLDPKHVLEAASAVLMFPYPLIKDHLSNLQAAVKDHIAYVTPNNFAELVKCLALSHRPRAELEHYQPLLRDIAAHFSTFAPKLRTSELIEVLEGFSFCNFKGASVYNVALTLVANIFSKIRIHDLLRILDSFSHVQLKHQDLFEKIGERALEDISRLERDDVETIVRSYLRVGYQGNLKNNSKFWDLVLSKKLLFSQSKHL